MSQQKTKSLLCAITQQWKESLYLIKNKQFWLATLKGTKDFYVILFKKWLFFFLGIFCMGIIAALLYPNVVIHSGQSVFIALAIMTLLALLIRPSLYKKDIKYFLSYSSLWYFVAWNMITLFFWVLHMLDLRIFGMPLYNVWLLWPGTAFYLFFLFDTRASLNNVMRSYSRAITLFICTLPISCSIWLLNIIFSFLIFFVTTNSIKLFMGSLVHAGILWTSILYIISIWPFMPFFLCLMNNIYIKNVYDHYDRYYQ